MQTGKGRTRFISNKYESKRRRGMLDSDNIDSNKLAWYGISGNLGGGRTDPDTYEVWQYPFPVDQSIRQKKKVDVRKVRPEIGD
jgi:hypothetical protein